MRFEGLDEFICPHCDCEITGDDFDEFKGKDFKDLFKLPYKDALSLIRYFENSERSVNLFSLVSEFFPEYIENSIVNKWQLTYDLFWIECKRWCLIEVAKIYPDLFKGKVIQLTISEFSKITKIQTDKVLGFLNEISKKLDLKYKIVKKEVIEIKINNPVRTEVESYL